ncbi:hypothetical protein GE09DRAFT_1263016 [Coniochaeta sp. 2T2.1]|nr:hypothetical protein GE09DRAFT_1263016 [Coniochaeta sp. 2T2.1]
MDRSTQDQFPCPLKCGETFQYKTWVEEHTRSAHRGKKLFPCGEGGCNKSFSSTGGRDQHQATHKPANVRCSWPGCNKAFHTYERVNRHLAKHTGIHKCPDCKIPFSTKNALKTHRVGHTEKRYQHKCRKCSWGGPSGKSVDSHMVHCLQYSDRILPPKSDAHVHSANHPATIELSPATYSTSSVVPADHQLDLVTRIPTSQAMESQSPAASYSEFLAKALAEIGSYDCIPMAAEENHEPGFQQFHAFLPKETGLAAYPLGPLEEIPGQWSYVYLPGTTEQQPQQQQYNSQGATRADSKDNNNSTIYSKNAGSTPLPTSQNPRGRKQSLTEDPSKTFVCELCNRCFRRQEHLKRHYHSLHVQDKPFECNECGKKFSRSDNLAQHAARTHGSGGVHLDLINDPDAIAAAVANHLLEE